MRSNVTYKTHALIREMQNEDSARKLARAKSIGGNCGSCKNTQAAGGSLMCNAKYKIIKPYNICYLYEQASI